MREVIAYRLPIGGAPHEAFPRAVELLAAWASGPDLTAADGEWKPGSGERLWWCSLGAPGGRDRLWTLTWHRPYEDDPDLRWRVEARVGRGSCASPTTASKAGSAGRTRRPARERSRSCSARHRSDISTTARGKFGQEYERTWNGHRITLGPHLAIGGAGSPSTIARIYWYVDDETKAVVVGHVGMHLRDTTTG